MLMHCITFAFLTMFLHFRCVIPMIKCYVLVGLDWPEPIISLMLHVICSCIFHTYIPSFLYILILNCLVLFCMTFFLFLSFINSSMAPKQKFVPSRNSLRFGASSSDSTPLHVRFRDDKAHKDFSENSSRCNIHSEHQVILSDFSDTDHPTII